MFRRFIISIECINEDCLSKFLNKIKSSDNFPRDYIFTIYQLWLTSRPRSTVVLLDTGTPGTSRENYSEDADDGTRTHNENKFLTVTPK